MDNEKIVRAELVALLKKGNAHMTLDEAVADFPVSRMNTKFTNGEYTFWHLLEHIRRAQEDILDFITNPNYKEREWPGDYWPPQGKKATARDWKRTISQFHKDSLALQKIVSDRKTDLYARIPHGTGQNIMREIIVVSDHNAYHIGEFAIMRQVANVWGKVRRP